jgi:ATP-binding cassette subfamily F protein uup
MIEWLEDYIRRQEFTVLMVTHDRYFLENVSTDIYELEAGSIYRYP